MKAFVLGFPAPSLTCLGRYSIPGNHVTPTSTINEGSSTAIKYTTYSPSIYPSDPSPLLTSTFLPNSSYSMADHSPSTRFRSLFESALTEYEKKTGITLTEHPLAIRLQSCHSIESTTAILQGQTQAFSKFRGRDRAIKSIKNTLSILTTLSDTATLGDSIGLVRHNVLVVYSTALTVFLYSHSHLRR